VIDESFEPIKTLKFVHERGGFVHKWGPMPNLIYAPLYAPLVAYWYSTGDLRSPSGDYPYGLERPFEQLGALIVVARLASVVIGLAATAIYGVCLVKLTGSRLAVFLALLLLLALSPPLIISFFSTKPDGMMLAFLAVSMAAYARIVGDGLTRGRGLVLSLFAVFSISCKELTAPAYVFPYMAIALSGWLRTRNDREAWRRFRADYALTVVSGVIAYLVVNASYAPVTWFHRVRFLCGSGGPADAAIWAPPAYTTSAYLHDVVRALMYDLGLGGVAITAVALVVSIIAPLRNRVLLWTPAVGFLMLAVLKLGYMPSYMMLPMNVLLALPVSAALAEALARWVAPGRQPIRLAAGALVLACIIINAWAANYAWALVRFSSESLKERYVRTFVGKDELVFLGNLWVRQPGAARLSYLGYQIDDRSLKALMSRPEPMPDVVLVNVMDAGWLAHLQQIPARSQMLADEGYDYGQFPGYEALGYRLVERFGTRLPWPLDIPWIPRWVRVWYPKADSGDILVYRKVIPVAGKPAAPRG
jgi:hypothetical protein